MYQAVMCLKVKNHKSMQYFCVKDVLNKGNHILLNANLATKNNFNSNMSLMIKLTNYCIN
jgi:hypothetical protein